VRSVDDAFGLDPLENLKQFRGLNRADGFVSEIRNHPFENLSSATAAKVLV
jgi:hypothetical protein